MSCAGVGQTLHVAAVGNDGDLYHTIRDADGSWQNTFGVVKAEVAGGPARYGRVGCASTGESLQLVGVGSDAELCHTIRNPDGTWQNEFGLVEGQVGGGPSGFATIGCGTPGGALHVIGGTFHGGWL